LEQLENFVAQFSGKIISVAVHDLQTGKIFSSTPM
jgi:hypothetical protein